MALEPEQFVIYAGYGLAAAIGVLLLLGIVLVIKRKHARRRRAYTLEEGTFGTPTPNTVPPQTQTMQQPFLKPPQPFAPTPALNNMVSQALKTQQQIQTGPGTTAHFTPNTLAGQAAAATVSNHYHTMFTQAMGSAANQAPLGQTEQVLRQLGEMMKQPAIKKFQ